MATIRRVWRLTALVVLLVLAVFDWPSAAAAQAAPGPVYVAEVDGTLTSVSVGYLRRALRLAEAADASALIIQVSSTGAVLRDVRTFAGDLAAAHVPVVAYVATPGTDSG
ncbi:MAG TPA: nodulation protein NfeD, partial [Roseiflexaceae bacterium]